MNYKIMVVDDDEDIRDIAEETLEKFGYKVFSAANAKEALEIISKEKDIHLFLLDLRLPEMNGIELCFEIRKNDPVSVIYAVTGCVTKEALIVCRKAGFDDYFSKPFDVKTLINIVHFAFDRLRRWEEYE